MRVEAIPTPYPQLLQCLSALESTPMLTLGGWLVQGRAVRQCLEKILGWPYPTKFTPSVFPTGLIPEVNPRATPNFRATSEDASRGPE